MALLEQQQQMLVQQQELHRQLQQQQEPHHQLLQQPSDHEAPQQPQQHQSLYPIPSALPPPPGASSVGSPIASGPYQPVGLLPNNFPLLSDAMNSISSSSRIGAVQQHSVGAYQRSVSPYAAFPAVAATSIPSHFYAGGIQQPLQQQLQQQHQQPQQLMLQQQHLQQQHVQQQHLQQQHVQQQHLQQQQQHLSVYGNVASPVPSARLRATSFFATEVGGPPLSSNSSSSSSSSSSSKLTLDDVKKDLQRRGVECPDSMWREPQPEEFQGFLSVALELAFGATLQKLRHEEMTGEVKVTHPDNRPFLTLEGRTHLRGIGNLRWFRQCQKLAKGVLGLQDFCRAHVFNPTPSTVLRFGIAFCTYLRLRDSVHAEAGPLAEALQQTQVATAKAEEDLRLTEQQLGRLTADRDAQQQHAAQLRKQRQSIRATVSSLEVELTSAQDKRALQEKQQQRMQQVLREAMQELSRLHQHREDLMDQIVHSPNKLKQKRTELQEEQRKLDSRIAELGLQRREQQLLQQQVARALKKAHKAERMLNTHKAAHLEPCVAARQDLRANEKTQKELLQRKQQLQQQMQQMQQDYQQQQQKLLQEEQQCSNFIRDLRLRVQQAKEEAEAFHRSLPAQQMAIESLQAQLAHLQVSIQRRRERHAELLQEMKAAEQQIAAAFRAYLAQLEVYRQSMPLPANMGQSLILSDEENEPPSAQQRHDKQNNDEQHDAKQHNNKQQQSQQDFQPEEPQQLEAIQEDHKLAEAMTRTRLAPRSEVWQ